MAGPADHRDQSGNEPNPGFSGPATAQFSAYPYQIDSELTMSANYSVTHFEAATAIESAGPNQMNSLSMDANGTSPAAAASDATMAPPQTPGQPAIVPAAQRGSVDELSDPGQTPQTGDKRKRVKASRACDECRRKKIRCDSPTEPGGIPKTCSNCQKAGVICEYERKPMKRGPSKGYIKELAERVQHMEHVQKQAFRQSLDGTSNLGGYAEPFSPDEPTGAAGFRRAISFSANTPFSSSEFQRDRIPSTGTWVPNPTSDSNLRARDRGSLAIAPNEMAPSTAPNQDQDQVKYDLHDAYWAEIEDLPPSKRPRLASRFESLEAYAMDPAFLNKYYNQIHPVFALLPNPDIVVAVVGKATPPVQHAFGAAIELLPDFEAKIIVNGTHDSTSTDHPTKPPKASLKSTAFINYDDMIELLGRLLLQHPRARSDEDNLALLWTIILLSVECENEVKLLNREDHCKIDFLTSGNAILSHLHPQRPSDSNAATVLDRAQFNSAVAQARHCATVLKHFHSLSIGEQPFEMAGGDPIVGGLAENETVPAEAAFLAHASYVAAPMIAALLEEDSSSPVALRMFRNVQKPLIRTVIGLHRRLAKDQPIVKQFEAFFELIFSRQQPLPEFPALILGAACALAESLVEDPEALSDTPRFNPLDIHAYSLATITLCEFLHDVSAKDMSEVAKKCLDLLRAPLEKKSAMFHKSYAFDWFYAPEGADPDTHEMCHWSDCLLNMIDGIKTKVAAGEVTTTANDRVSVPRFSDMLRRGWLRILLHYRKKN